MTTIKKFFNRRKHRSLGDKSICFKLYHFPTREKSECVKYLFAYLMAPYEGVQISFNEWNTMGMAKDAPFGHLPVLDVDGRKIAGTIPILRFLGRYFHLNPASNFDQAEADMYADEIDKLSERLKPVNQAGFFLQDSERKAREWKKYKNEELTPALNTLEKRLGRQKFMCGDRICWVDFMVVEFLDRLETSYEAGGLKLFPSLMALHTKIHETPSMKVYLQQRPHSPY